MDSLIVSAESKEYPIYFTSDFSGLCDACKEAGLKKTKAFIVSDRDAIKKAFLENDRIVCHLRI